MAFLLMAPLTFTAEITPDRKLKWLGATREIVVQMVAEAYPNGTIEVVFKKKTRRRTNPQNAYYWGVVLQIILCALQNMGNDDIADVEQLHEWFKSKFLKPTAMRDKDGKIIGHLPPSTKNLSTVEYKKFTEDVADWGTVVLDIYIPPPPEKDNHNF